MIAYLALNQDRPHTREELATLLWGDRFEEQARHSLRQSVLALRKALVDEDASILRSSGELLALSTEAVEVDALEFQRLTLEGSQDSLERATTLYTGDLLAGVRARSEIFDEWLSVERVRYRDVAIDAYAKLIRCQADIEDIEVAVGTAQRLLEIDPSNEDAHRSLMSLYDASGKRAAALRQYRTYVDVLRREFDAEPDPSLSRLHSEIQARDQLNDLAPARERVDHAVDSQVTDKHLVKNIVDPDQVNSVSPAVQSAKMVSLPVESQRIFDRPAIAVLPFENMSGDPEQEYFADGITEDIISSLSRWRHIPVIARNSTFVYKGQAVNVNQVGTDLGVQYILEGSVRKSGERVRITAQLVEAGSGQQVWGERYDRGMEDIFTVQDEISERIVVSIDPAIRIAETRRAIRKPPENMDAWDHLLRGLWHTHKFKKDENAEARHEFQQAIEMDQNFGLAHAWLSVAHFYDVWLEWSDVPRDSLNAAYDCAKTAVALDEMEAMAHIAFCCANFWLGRFDSALVAGRRAIDLNPSGALCHFVYGVSLIFDGQPEEAIPVTLEPMRLSPNDPLLWVFCGTAALARLLCRQEEVAVDMSRKAVQIRHGYVIGRAILTSALSHLGQAAEAEAEFAEIMRLKPNFSAATLDAYPFRVQSHKDYFLEGLRMAGLPD